MDHNGNDALHHVQPEPRNTSKLHMTDWDVWLYPELKRGWDLRFGGEKPYQEEEEKLRERQNNKCMLG